MYMKTLQKHERETARTTLRGSEIAKASSLAHTAAPPPHDQSSRATCWPIIKIRGLVALIEELAAAPL